MEAFLPFLWKRFYRFVSMKYVFYEKLVVPSTSLWCIYEVYESSYAYFLCQKNVSRTAGGLSGALYEAFLTQWCGNIKS